MKHPVPVRVGVIGYGYWGPNLVRNFAAATACRVSAVADLSRANLDKLEATHPAIKTTQDAREIIANPEIDAVIVASPVSTHHPLAKAALLAGKHVLVEKPLAQSVAQARELVAIAKATERTLMVDHTFVFTGAVRKIRRLLEGDELGELYYFDSARINLGLFQNDANVLWDLAPHDLSILIYLIDERPQQVQAKGHRYVGKCQDEIAYLTLRYRSGFHANIRVSWLSPVKMRLTLLGGSRKMVVYDDVEPSEKVRIYDRGVTYGMPFEEVTSLSPIYRSGDVLIPELERTEALRLVAQHFLHCIRTKKEPITGGEAGLDVVRILAAAQESLDRGGAWIDIADDTRTRETSEQAAIA